MGSRCLVAGSADLTSALLPVLEARGWDASTSAALGFDDIAEALATPAPDVVAVVVLSAPTSDAVVTGREALLSSLRLHAGWARAALLQPVPAVVHGVVSSPLGAVAAQAVAHLVRCLGTAWAPDAARQYAIEMTGAGDGAIARLAELITRLGSDDDGLLVGQDLVAAEDWVGLRSQPQPAATVSFAPDVDLGWLDAALRAVLPQR